jgi:hypothetical protein
MSRKTNFKLYRVWDGIVQRCYNHKAKNYHNYGGRGIKMLEEWRNSFASFEDFCLSNGWVHGLQIDRIDNDGGYFPGNIRFVTRAENLRNKRTNNMVTFNGETRCMADWSNLLGISESTLWRRFSSGWRVEDAFTKPIQRHKKSKMDGEADV